MHSQDWHSCTLQLVDLHRFQRPESLGISILQTEHQKLWGSFVDFCFLPPDMLNALLRMSKDFHWSIRMARIDSTRFHNDNRYILSLNWSISTIQKSNTPIKTAITTTGIPVKNKAIFGMRIFLTTYGLEVLWQAKNQCAPDVLWG